jgi:hypothetical protein
LGPRTDAPSSTTPGPHTGSITASRRRRPWSRTKTRP